MKKSSILAFIGMSAMASAMENLSYNPNQGKVKPNLSRSFGPKIPSNHKYFSFRADGTFTTDRTQEPMLKSECVFSCFALNSKNAIRKFNQFNSK